MSSDDFDVVCPGSTLGDVIQVLVTNGAYLFSQFSQTKQVPINNLVGFDQ